MTGGPTVGRPTLAVWKFASCDGCQLTLLDCEDELLEVAERLDIAYFLEASTASVDGPYDLSLVEGSITTPEDIVRIQRIRSESKHLVAIGACATAGGIQALRDFADVESYAAVVYAQPEDVDALATSTPISEHVEVDFELRGCPIAPTQLLEVISAFLHDRRPAVSGHSVCMECKRRGLVCLTVASGVPCLGPVTHAGCGALCPSFHRGCYGCFGPMDHPNVEAMTAAMGALGVEAIDQLRMLRTFNAAAQANREVSVEIGRRLAEVGP